MTVLPGLFWALLLAQQAPPPIQDVLVLPKSDEPYDSLSLSPDGKTVVAYFRTSSVLRTWSVEDGGKNPKSLKFTNSTPWQFALNESGTRLLASTAEEIVEWDLQAGTVPKTAPRPIDPANPNDSTRSSGLLPTADGKGLFISSGFKQHLVLLSAETLEVIQWLPFDGVVPESVSSDGLTLICRTEQQELYVCDLKKQRLSRILKHPGLSQVNVSADGKLAASSGNLGEYPKKVEGSIRIWDVDKGKLLRQWKTDGLIRSIALSPPGGVLATLSDQVPGSPILTFWDTTTGKAVWAPLKASGDARCLSFSREGKRLAFVGTDGSLHVVNVPPTSFVAPK